MGGDILVSSITGGAAERGALGCAGRGITLPGGRHDNLIL